ncbi:MAG: hypothetical protein ACTSQU_04045 [Promethearchaeota archaeon]
MHTDHSDAVNLDVLLLKAKALDLSEIREEIKKRPKPKAISKKTTTKKPPAKKPTPKKTAQDKPKKQEKAGKKVQTLSEDDLREMYHAETDKNAEWRGKLTKGYLMWKKKRLG